MKKLREGIEPREVVFILDAGHGIETPGKRSPVWEDGRQLFEWEFNRAIVDRVSTLLTREQISHISLCLTDEDIPLSTRVGIANDLGEDIDTFYVSIHANAGGGTGFEIFTSPGQTESDLFADIIATHYAEEFPELRFRADRSDGDHDKEARFYVLTKTKMPAVLIEAAFMDTLTPDCELLMSEKGRDRMAHAIFRGLKQIYAG